MIALETLADIIEGGLNSNSSGIKYKIYSDMGEFKKAVNTRTEKERYTNGVLEVVNSSLVPTQSITVATQLVLLTVVVALPDPKTDKEIISKHRSILDGYFSGVKVQGMSDGTKAYSVSSVGSFANTGEVEVRPKVGTSITFTVSIQYSYIENGLNSTNCVFVLDNMEIPYSTAQITRHSTVESNPYSNSDATAENIETAESIGFDFQIPASETEFGLFLLRQILRGDRSLYELKVTLGTEEETYSVMFGETALAVKGVDNAGHKISLINAASSVGD